MRTSICFTVLSLCLFFALPSIASAQGGGNGPGACLIDDFDKPAGTGDGEFPPFSACVDDVSAIECAALCGEPVGDDPGGIGIFCDFLPGQTCAGTGIPWDGACEGTTPVGDLCVLLASPQCRRASRAVAPLGRVRNLS